MAETVKLTYQGKAYELPVLEGTCGEKAIDISKKVKNKIYTVKLGLEIWNSHGKEGVKKFNDIGINNCLLDLKLKDVGTTIYKSILALDNTKFGYLTVHGQGGKEMIEEAKKAVNEIKCKPKIMMVTILTSLSDKDMKDLGNEHMKLKNSG